MHKFLVPLMVLWCSFIFVAPTHAQDPTESQKRMLRKQVEEQLKRQLKGKKLPPAEVQKIRDRLMKQALRRMQARINRKPGRFEKRSPSVMKAFAPVIQNARQSTVEVKCDGRRTLLAMVIDSDGWILTKASELNGVIRCRLADGREMDAILAGVHKRTDLAMLKVNTKDLTPIQWSSKGVPQIGEWVATVGLQETPVSIGVVSVNPRKIAKSGGLLGVGLDETDDGPKVNQVMPGSGAEKAGIKTGDLILGVNGKKTLDRAKLIATVGGYAPGDRLILKIKRKDKELILTAKLGARRQSSRAVMQNTMGGPLSKRRANFPKALQHDTILQPYQCGGPLVDLDGFAVGINIARSGRVESLALTQDVIMSLIPDFKAGKFLPPDPTMSEQLIVAEKKLSDVLVLVESAEKAEDAAQQKSAKTIEEINKLLKKTIELNLQTQKESKKNREAARKVVQEIQKELDQIKAKTNDANKKRYDFFIQPTK